MSAGWEIGAGDLVVCVDVDVHRCGGKFHAARTLALGAIFRVSGVMLADCGNCLGLVFEDGTLAIACRFRKIRPDEQTGEMSDWELILDCHTRKQPVRA